MNYIHGQWGHLFPTSPTRETTCRIVVDAAQETLVAGEICTSFDGSEPATWRPMRANEKADLVDSLKNGNAEMFDNPKDFGLDVSDDAPDWAKLALQPTIKAHQVDGGYAP